jgi:hypothetical protein
MPGGKFDSSKTRVGPVFDALWSKGRDWLPQLLALPAGGCSNAEVKSADLKVVEKYWEPNEKSLRPPVSLLSWLIRNVSSLSRNELDDGFRKRLTAGDPETLELALRLLRTENATRGWYIFEGPTYPDVYLESKDALVVIEGKRTEPTATVETKWLDGRHQIWRHIDAAWEIRGRRAVYGFFIVESDAFSSDGSVPELWNELARNCAHSSALLSSFPHRSAAEVSAISRCLLGVTTWRKVCEQFHIDWRTLPHEVASSDS